MPVSKTQEARANRFLGVKIPFAELGEPGTYVSNWSGHLLRIPEDALKSGRSPVIEILGPDIMYVTKLSDDPFMPLTKARMAAADNDLTVNF